MTVDGGGACAERLQRSIFELRRVRGFSDAQGGRCQDLAHFFAVSG